MIKYDRLWETMKEKAAGTVPAARMFFLSIISEKVIIFGMLHYILNIVMQNVA